MAKRFGLTLSASRLWTMSMAFRLYFRPRNSGFAPGLRNLLRYELRRVRLVLHDRDRLAYYAAKLRSLWTRGQL